MEASKELDGGLMRRLLPPRLEDAGLEDCALPPDAIKEAFLRAANAAKSRATSIFTSDEDEESEGYCVKDPLLVEDKPTDVVVGILPELEPPGSCAGAKGLKFPDIGEDELVVGGGEIDCGEIRDRLVGGDERKEGEKPCVDGWQGIAEKGGKSLNNNDGDEKEQDKDAEQPVLTEGNWSLDIEHLDWTPSPSDMEQPLHALTWITKEELGHTIGQPSPPNI